MAATAPVQTMSPSQRNGLARQIVLANSVENVQQLPAVAVTPANQSVINFTPQNFGILRGFLIRVDFTLANAGASNAARTEWGAANVLSNVTFVDFQNITRISVPGWYLAHLATAKQGYGFGAAYAPNLPINYGSNYTVQSLASSITSGGGTATGRMIYWLPLAYSADDLRGSIFAGVVQANANLQVTINTTPGYTTGDPTLAIAGGTNTTVAYSGSVTVTVSQVTLDQLPTAKNGSPILPMDDLSTIYDLKSTSVTGMVTGTDFAIAYPNLRSFLSTTVIYDNAGTLAAGTNINFFALQAANSAYIWKLPVAEAALGARQELMSDPPVAAYYFSHRKRPIITQQYGNMNLIINPTGTVNAGAQFMIGWESFQKVAAIALSGSFQS